MGLGQRAQADSNSHAKRNHARAAPTCFGAASFKASLLESYPLYPSIDSMSDTQAPTPAPFGVIYTPDTVDNRSIASNLALLSNPAIKYVRLQWLDYTNTLRFRVLPVSYFRRLLSSARPGTGIAKCALGLVFLKLAPGFSSSGEYLTVPDLLSLRVAPYAPGHASVMAYFEEKVPTPEYGLVVPVCPRTLLKRIVE